LKILKNSEFPDLYFPLKKDTLLSYREKQIKNWTRKKKEFLMCAMNPVWKDLTEELAG